MYKINKNPINGRSIIVCLKASARNFFSDKYKQIITQAGFLKSDNAFC